MKRTELTKENVRKAYMKIAPAQTQTLETFGVAFERILMTTATYCFMHKIESAEAQIIREACLMLESGKELI